MADTVIKRHPIRGFLYGIVFGLGLVLLAVGQSWVALGTTPPLLLFIAGVVLGTLWGAFGPAKPPKGSPPPEPVEVEQHDVAADTDEADDGFEAPDEAGDDTEAGDEAPDDGGEDAADDGDEPVAGG